jgi:2-C-methyl-D-erythritol 4-phosphate cytidylyltransferase / 2-C-methyl-D-erythritol 2,4-cyclodiphosphate synthase
MTVKAAPARAPGAPVRVAALVVAAGRGERLGGDVPKQYRMLAGRTVLARSMAAILAEPSVVALACVIGAPDENRFHQSRAMLPATDQPRLLPPALGGATRQASVLAGLEALAGMAGGAPDLVLVHDAARPFATPALVARAVQAAITCDAAVPGLAVTDTIKQIDASGRIEGTADRTRLRAVQTPQAFRFAPLLAAHRAAATAGATGLTDDAAVMEWSGHGVDVFEGEAGNMKITTAEDLAEAERRLSRVLETRVATGFDVHAFGEGHEVILGGIAIPHERGLAGHSDADVVLHALTDAVLGALADGDIGSHFPPSDMTWKGASSDRFLAFAVERVRARGGRIDHLDATIICEAPKIGPHREAMRARIAAIACVPVGRVGVKATTSEQLGFTGRREGIAAQATATLRLPPEPEDAA